MLSEISQTEKDNFFMISHMWNVNKTKQNKTKVTHWYREQTDSWQKEGDGKVSKIVVEH